MAIGAAPTRPSGRYSLAAGSHPRDRLATCPSCGEGCPSGSRLHAKEGPGVVVIGAATILPPAFRPRPAIEPMRTTARAVNALCFGLRSLARAA